MGHPVVQRHIEASNSFHLNKFSCVFFSSDFSSFVSVFLPSSQELLKIETVMWLIYFSVIMFSVPQLGCRIRGKNSADVSKYYDADDRITGFVVCGLPEYLNMCAIFLYSVFTPE
jgi:hypothetical protein